MDPYARGGFLGLTFEHKRHHFIRAIMEGVVFALRDSLEIFKDLGVKIEKVISRGGGSRSDLWLQIQADILNSEVFKSEVEEDSAFGAALLASVGAGIYRDLDEACSKTMRYTVRKHPEEERVKLYDRIYKEIYRHLYYSLRHYWSPLQ